jgi:hypothetical protein
MKYKGHAEADAVLFSFGPIKFGSVFQVVKKPPPPPHAPCNACNLNGPINFGSVFQVVIESLNRAF